jgi:hypothetical protein
MAFVATPTHKYIRNRSYAAVGGGAPFDRGLTHHGYKSNGAMRLFGLDNYAFGIEGFYC